MAILGGGGHSANDPIYVDTLESLKEVFEDTTNKYTHIAFPEVYDGPKVIDLRSRGWNPINIGYRSDWSENRYVYCNNWTILGLSIMDSWFWALSSSSSKTTYVYDLIMKNVYVIAITSEACCFCNTSSGYGHFVRCKFSAVLDANNNHVSFVNQYYNPYGSSSTGRRMYATQCSFNTELHTQGNSLYAKVIGSPSNTNEQQGDIINCIFNINAPFLRFTNNSNEQTRTTTYQGRFRFCKWIGSVKGYQNRIHFIQGGSNSAYNVVDVDFYSYFSSSSSTCVICVAFSSGVNIINSDRFHSVNSTIQTSLSRCTKVTQAQMTDQDYLNSIEFICGNTPSDAPPHKQRLILHTHLRERRCA
jgi:hypothetical protein